jgi:hypothetical protein
MKKTLLLSMAASAVLFAGGDIAPVVVPEVPTEPCATSNLKWYGQTVLYYQTTEAGNAATNFELFDGNVARANAGLKLGVTGSNLMGTGLGFGAEVIALGTLGLEKDNDGAGNQDYVSNVMAGVNGNLNGGEVTQMYLSYAMGNTAIKAGRMELPKSLSPLAFSETWNVFANTFEAALVVNTDLPDTTLVGAWVARGNGMRGSAVGIYDLGVWNDIGANDNGAFMVTAVNKTIEGLTLTGTFYYLAEAGVAAEDAMALWGDAKFAMPVAGNTIAFGVQGGMIDVDDVDPTIAYGAKASGTFNIPAFGSVALCAAYSGVDLQNGAANLAVRNLATGIKTPLYTQMVLNQDYISGALSAAGTADTMMVKGTATYDIPALGNVAFTVAYSMTERETGAGVAMNDYNELDVVATTKLGGAEVLAAYVMTEVDDGNDATDMDAVRIWAKWNF